MSNFIEIEETLCGRTYVVRTYVRMHARTDGHLRPALLGRLCRRVDLKTDHVTMATLLLGVITVG